MFRLLVWLSLYCIMKLYSRRGWAVNAEHLVGAVKSWRSPWLISPKLGVFKIRKSQLWIVVFRLIGLKSIESYRKLLWQWVALAMEENSSTIAFTVFEIPAVYVTVVSFWRVWAESERTFLFAYQPGRCRSYYSSRSFPQTSFKNLSVLFPFWVENM